ncbi:probable plastid-lipid-associated protein 13, chloroplastic [Aristolochia californica]|uniref:probable plastid-lipid-associated protein 13, chloroplastic n=1 Tax=Aristolochia californica TaxID=171875 RepID=UPI0035D9ABAC
MAAMLVLVPNLRTVSAAPSSLSLLTISLGGTRRNPASSARFRQRKSNGKCCIAMLQQTEQGASAIYAKDMEKLSAKESLLLAFKDSGGLEALVSGRITDVQRIDVNERITGLERLNPTPRPTTSPYLEGRWSFQWFGAGSPGLFAAKFLFERFPTIIANLLDMDMLIKDGYSKATANLKFLGSIDSKVTLTCKVSVEGPLRMKEEYVEGIIDTPTVSEEVIPEQLKSAFGQALGTLQQLPVPIKEAAANGVKIPLNGTFQRMFMISYLDEEILIIRDTAGVPDVLTRLDPPSVLGESVGEYES